MEPKSYNLKDLCRLAGVTERTVRYYIKEGLLPTPVGSGAFSRYTEEHRVRLHLIRQLKAEFLPLGAIKNLLEGRLPAELAELARQYDQTSRTDQPKSPGLAAHLRSETTPSLRQTLAQPDPLRRPYGLSFQPGTPSGPEMNAAPGPAGPTRLVYRPPLFQPDEPAESSLAEWGDQWQRVELVPGVELHIRQPLSENRRTRLAELIETARRLLEE